MAYFNLFTKYKYLPIFIENISQKWPMLAQKPITIDRVYNITNDDYYIISSLPEKIEIYPISEQSQNIPLWANKQIDKSFLFLANQGYDNPRNHIFDPQLKNPIALHKSIEYAWMGAYARGFTHADALVPHELLAKGQMELGKTLEEAGYKAGHFFDPISANNELDALMIKAPLVPNGAKVYRMLSDLYVDLKGNIITEPLNYPIQPQWEQDIRNYHQSLFIQPIIYENAAISTSYTMHYIDVIIRFSPDPYYNNAQIPIILEYTLENVRGYAYYSVYLGQLIPESEQELLLQPHLRYIFTGARILLIDTDENITLDNGKFGLILSYIVTP